MNAANILRYLTIDSHAGPEALRSASRELATVGVMVEADDLRAALARVRADRHPTTGEWKIPSHVAPAWGFDDLQDAIMDGAPTLRGAALACAWSRVKGHLRLRWAAGNFARPRNATLIRWATTDPQT